ncbi:MAG TPA: CHRD domain-containing protein [Thermoanaerobaculia bacterium]
MRAALRLFIVLLLALPLFAQVTTLSTVLTGANERPNPGDPNGIGFAVVRLDPAAGTVSYSLVAQNITGVPVAAHIHRGLSDVAGGVVVDFAPTFTNGFASATVNADPALIREIIANPGLFYVNVHSAAFPAGAIRGQLGGNATGSATFMATMNGANERPNPGDPDGTGFAVVRFDRASGTVRYAIVTRDINPPVAAHIHRGGADVAGPVVVDFAPTFVNGAAAGTRSVATALIDEILANPAGFYVNVHNADFPGGAVRGQLVGVSADATDSVFPVTGRVVGANGTFYRTDVALLNVSGAPTPVVLEFYPSGNAGNTTPTHTATLILASGEQVNLNGDVLQQTLGITADGTGAIRVVAPRQITAVSRIYNDQRARDTGTFGQFVPALGADYNRTSGALPMLSNQQGLTGFRSNIGWFNGSNATSTVTFRAHRPNGTVLQTNTISVPPGQQLQVSLNQIFNTLEPLDQLYVTFSTTGAPLYVYASVVDNTNGDAVFIASEPR